MLDQKQCAGKNDSFSVYFASNQMNHARIGISVSSKIGNAVVRARIRRQLRAMVNLCDVLQKPFDIVIIARSGFQKKTFNENSMLLIHFLQHLSCERITHEKTSQS